MWLSDAPPRRCCRLHIAGAVPARLFSLVWGIIVDELKYSACFASTSPITTSTQQVAVRDFVVSAVLPGEAVTSFCVACRCNFQSLAVVALQSLIQSVSVAAVDELSLSAAVWAFVDCGDFDWCDGVCHCSVPLWLMIQIGRASCRERV